MLRTGRLSVPVRKDTPAGCKDVLRLIFASHYLATKTRFALAPLAVTSAHATQAISVMVSTAFLTRALAFLVKRMKIASTSRVASISASAKMDALGRTVTSFLRAIPITAGRMASVKFWGKATRVIAIKGTGLRMEPVTTSTNARHKVPSAHRDPPARTCLAHLAANVIPVSHKRQGFVKVLLHIMFSFAEHGAVVAEIGLYAI